MENSDVEVIREGKIIAVLASREHEYSLDQMGLTMDSSDSEVLVAMEPVFEEEGISLDGISQTYIVKRQTDSGNIYIFPKSTAGTGRSLSNYSKLKSPVEYLIIDQEDDWFTACETEEDLQKELKLLTKGKSLNSDIEIYKVIEAYKVDVQLKKIEGPSTTVL